MLSQIKKKLSGNAVISKFADIGALEDCKDEINELPLWNGEELPQFNRKSQPKIVKGKQVVSKIAKDTKSDQMGIDNQENIPVNVAKAKREFSLKKSATDKKSISEGQKSAEINRNTSVVWSEDSMPSGSKECPTTSDMEGDVLLQLELESEQGLDEDWKDDFFGQIEQSEHNCEHVGTNTQSGENFVQYPADIVFSKVRHNRVEYVQEALSNGFDANKARDPNGNTMLHIAVSN